ncbi:glycosyltransferase [Methylotuvimicrobium sp. KM1]|uniref:glycosyltransferase n=1 Tax=Methylotuvimicrobium sp. KM1 TaxID=3377707 RepID=UPI00384C3490
MKLSIVICTHNRSASLIKTLTSLYDDNYLGLPHVEILVVANNCSDDTIGKLIDFNAKHPHEILKLNWLKEFKPGKSNALNTAIKKTSAELLCFIDDDQIVESGFLKNLLKGLKDYPDNDIYCGQLTPAWDGSEPFWVHTKGKYSVPIRPYPEFDLGETSITLTEKHKIPSGGNITVRRMVFEKIGNFSVELGPTGHNMIGGEDHEFISRAIQAGHTIRYLPEVKQLHAIDNIRTKTLYTLKKSFYRSRSSYLVKQTDTKYSIPLFMFRKILYFSTLSIFSLKQEHRFYYLVRLFSSLGELSGALHNIIHQK